MSQFKALPCGVLHDLESTWMEVGQILQLKADSEFWPCLQFGLLPWIAADSATHAIFSMFRGHNKPPKMLKKKLRLQSAGGKISIKCQFPLSSSRPFHLFCQYSAKYSPNRWYMTLYNKWSYLLQDKTFHQTRVNGLISKSCKIWSQLPVASWGLFDWHSLVQHFTMGCSMHAQ